MADTSAVERRRNLHEIGGIGVAPTVQHHRHGFGRAWNRRPAGQGGAEHEASYNARESDCEMLGHRAAP